MNITSGVDAERNGLYTDRTGALRNSGHGPAFHDLELYGRRKIPIPTFWGGAKHRAAIDLAVHVQNVLATRNYAEIGTIVGSPLFGRPLSALAGRSIRLSLGVHR